MADLVRVNINGVEKNVGREYAEIHELDVLDVSAYGDDGQVRPDIEPKPRTTVDDEAANKKASKK